MKNKGLSDVITIVLMILLVMAGIIILWNFIAPTLSSANINTDAYTTSFSIPPSSVTLDPNSNNLTLDINRGAGQGNVIGFLVGLQDPAGNIKTFRENLTINQLETKQFGVNYTGFPMDDITSITVTPIFRNNQTLQEQLGQPITQPVPTQNKKFKFPSGMIAHWKFDSGYIDDVNSISLSTSGATSLIQSGQKIGSGAVTFGGGGATDYLSYADTLGLFNQNAFTIVAWVNPQSINPGGMIIFSKVSARPSGGYKLYYTSTYGWQLVTFGAASNQNPGVTATADSQWHFIGAAFTPSSPSNISLDYDGSFTSTSAPNAMPFSALQTLQIGGSLSGSVDEVMFFNRNLSAQEIESIRTGYKG